MKVFLLVWLFQTQTGLPEGRQLLMTAQTVGPMTLEACMYAGKKALDEMGRATNVTTVWTCTPAEAPPVAKLEVTQPSKQKEAQ